MKPPRAKPRDRASDKRLQDDAEALYHELFLSASRDPAVAILKKALSLSRIAGMNAAIVAGKAHALARRRTRPRRRTRKDRTR